MVEVHKMKQGQDGFTLMELMVAMFMASLVTAAAFVLWNGYSSYMIKQRKMVNILDESYSIGYYLKKKLKQSKTILSWSDKSITYIDMSNDTLTLSADEKNILVGPSPQYKILGEFRLKELTFRSAGIDREKGFMLFEVNYTAEAKEGRERGFRFLMMLPCNSEGDNEGLWTDEFENFG